MTPDQMRLVTGFATGLATLKARHEQNQPAELTADEVAGIIWGIRQLRGEANRGPADHPA